MEGILITGVTGFLGSALLDAAVTLSVPILPLGGKSYDKCQQSSRYYRQSPPIASVDFRKPEMLQAWVKNNQPQPLAIIHAGAVSNAAYCEAHPEEAFAVNSESVKQLSEVFPGVPLVYVSTDLVFDGCESAPQAGFDEKSEPRPVSVYARSKFAGENYALNNPTGYVARTSLLLGRQLNQWAGFVGWMAGELQAGKSVSLFHDEFRTPIWARDVAMALFVIVDRIQQGTLAEHRIINLSGPQRLSRLELGKEICAALGFQSALLHSTSRNSLALVPARPHDVSLANSLAGRLIGFQPEFPTQILKHCSQG